MNKFYLHPLGCAKNTVNAEQMTALLLAAGFVPAKNPAQADVAIVNTCGFIDSAKAEAIEAILALGRLKTEGRLKALVVAGCLSERYHDQFAEQLPEVDAVVGVGSYTEIVAAVQAALHKKAAGPAFFMAPREEAALDGPRALLNPPYWAWLRVAEGCDNRCAYCAIPGIRGPFRSRSLESVTEEARQLVAGGARELILIAQDTTRYGLDRYGRLALIDLLRALESIEDLRWIRVHYLYPDELGDDLLAYMAASAKVLPYFDIPLQHVADRVLRAMNRRGDGAFIRGRIGRIRALLPHAVIRTTLIVGFPGETEADFEELCEFLRQYRLERVGVFCYSQEEGTPAHDFPDQIPEPVKLARQSDVYLLQQDVMEAHGQSLVGKTLTVLCCGADPEGRIWGRSYMDSPDVDGAVWLDAGREGSFYTVEITGADGCDLYGRVLGPAD